MAQIRQTVDPFGEVNIYPALGGKMRVTATILMEPHKEGTQTGIALDGSYSMEALYGGEEEPAGFFSKSFGGQKKKIANQITPVAQRICAYLAQDRRRWWNDVHLLGDRFAGRSRRGYRRLDRG